MKIGILNSGGFNFNSIKFALNRLGIFDVEIVKSPSEFELCDRIIIPGVGHAKTAMSMIKTQNLGDCIKKTQKPVLGICLGMQIMFEKSAEGGVDCLGIFDGEIVKIPDGIRSPQMGWNKIIGGEHHCEFVFFANSFYAPTSQHTESFVEYFGVEISAIVRKNNFLGCQFHPEKSGVFGEKILNDFISL